MIPPAWTTEEDDKLRTLWATDDHIQTIAEKLGRTYEAIRRRTAKLGMPTRERKPQRTVWSHPGVDEVLRNLWIEGKSATEVSQAINRMGFRTTRLSVIGRVSRLGLGRTPEGVSQSKRTGGLRSRFHLVPGGKPWGDKPASARKLSDKRSLLHAPNHVEQHIANIAAASQVKPLVIADPSLPTLVQLTGCKFPIGDVARGDGAEQRFCGKVKVAGKPYCPACCRIAYGFTSERGSDKRWMRGVVRAAG